jgi:hypothetical protein
VFQIKVVDRIATHIFLFHSFFQKSCRLGDNVEKCCGTIEAADDNMAARCMLG